MSVLIKPRKAFVLEWLDMHANIIKRYVSQESGSRFIRLNVVVGANACVISARLCSHYPSRPWDSVGLCLV